MLIHLSLLFSLAEPEPNHKCNFPNDCLTHDTSRTDLPCEKKSDRWQRYQNATPYQRKQMRARWREPMRDRIIRIYEVDASERKMILEEVNAIYAEKATVFEEAKRLDEAISNYTATFTKELRLEERNDAMKTEEAVLRRLLNDPKYQFLLDRRKEIERSCQIDWNDALKRIEKLLPKVQVQKGRDRLDIELPHRCCKLWIEDETTNIDEQRDDDETVHPWEAHVERFIERYRLNVGKIGAARSLLREIRQRASQVDRRRFKELAAAHSLGDSVALQAHIEEFELRIDDLFDELNMRLDALLLSSQR